MGFIYNQALVFISYPAQKHFQKIKNSRIKNFDNKFLDSKAKSVKKKYCMAQLENMDATLQAKY